MRRTLKWSAPLGALLALGVAGPSNAQTQDFQTNIGKAQKTLSDLIAVLDKIDARQKAAKAASESGGSARTVASAPTGVGSSGGRTYTLILTGAQ